MPPKKEIKYRTCLVSFFDLLGFREMVKNETPAEIASRVALFQSSGEIDSATGRAFEAQSFQFSDSIVRMMPIDSEANSRYPGGLLFHEILTIVHASLEMANRGAPISRWAHNRRRVLLRFDDVRPCDG
jgi:hypothetical protein